MQDAQVLQILVLVGAAVVALSWLGRRLGVAPPVVLLVGGVALGFVPWLEGVRLPPEVVLLIFFPALLYWESLTTSLREIRANLRAVMLSSVLLVLATAGVVAVVGHAFGLSWPVAWVLGAVVAPTDATAVAAVADRMPQWVVLRRRGGGRAAHGMARHAGLARLPDDGAEAVEQQLAERAATEAGLAAIPAVAARLGSSPAVSARVRADYESTCTP